MVDNPLFVAFLAIVTSIIASSGFWAFIQRRDTHKNARNQLLLSVSHILIVYVGLQYIERGWLTKNEYDNLQNLYKPYLELGGNGLADKIIQDVSKLPIAREKK